jgi:hypothetical protein
MDDSPDQSFCGIGWFLVDYTIAHADDPDLLKRRILRSLSGFVGLIE